MVTASERSRKIPGLKDLRDDSMLITMISAWMLLAPAVAAVTRNRHADNADSNSEPPNETEQPRS